MLEIIIGFVLGYVVRPLIQDRVSGFINKVRLVFGERGN